MGKVKKKKVRWTSSMWNVTNNAHGTDAFRACLKVSMVCRWQIQRGREFHCLAA